MADFQIISRRQIELGIHLRLYRYNHKFSLKQTAQIASAYGAPYKVKFAISEISCYEQFKNIPSENKMNALLSMMNLAVEDLDI